MPLYRLLIEITRPPTDLIELEFDSILGSAALAIVQSRLYADIEQGALSLTDALTKSIAQVEATGSAFVGVVRAGAQGPQSNRTTSKAEIRRALGLDAGELDAWLVEAPESPRDITGLIWKKQCVVDRCTRPGVFRIIYGTAGRFRRGTTEPPRAGGRALFKDRREGTMWLCSEDYDHDFPIDGPGTGVGQISGRRSLRWANIVDLSHGAIRHDADLWRFKF